MIIAIIYKIGFGVNKQICCMIIADYTILINNKFNYKMVGNCFI